MARTFSGIGSLYGFYLLKYKKLVKTALTNGDNRYWILFLRKNLPQTHVDFLNENVTELSESFNTSRAPTKQEQFWRFLLIDRNLEKVREFSSDSNLKSQLYLRGYCNVISIALMHELPVEFLSVMFENSGMEMRRVSHI
jgi:hypothetical protein